MRNNSTTTNSTAATIRIIVILSTSILLVLLVSKKRIQILRHDNHGRAQNHHEKRWKNKQYQRKYQLHTGFRGLLFYLLAALGPECFGMHAQGLGNARPKLFRLHQHRSQ